MVKFRNIRVKMRGGKSRIQRAMVLASGKLKFVKNLSRSRSSAPRHKTTKTHRSVRTSMARRKRHGGGGGILRTVKKVAMAGAGLAPIVIAATYPGDAKSKLDYGISEYTGYSFMDKQWHLDRAAVTYGLPVAVTVGFKVVSFVNKIFRRL